MKTTTNSAVSLLYVLDSMRDNDDDDDDDVTKLLIHMRQEKDYDVTC